MRKVVVLLSALMVANPLFGQRIETRRSGEDQIVKVETALNHLTVIQLAEPVLSVAAGSEAFKVEWRANKVFVEPTQAGVSTNLFIWTKSGRENYELEPAGSVETMDFAIDTQAVDPQPQPKAAAQVRVPGDPLKAAADVMLGGTPVRQESWKARKGRIQVMVRDLFQQDGIVYVRYSITNGTKRAYQPGTPRVIEVISGVSRAALAARVYTQLGEKAAENLKTRSEAPLDVTAHELRGSNVLAGGVTVGVVGVKLAGSGPAILRLEFRDDQSQPVSAVVVI